MIDTLKVGIIGIGDISKVYIENLKSFKMIELVACAGRNLEKAKAIAEKYGIPKAYGSPEELLDDPEINTVLNLTTPESHYKYNLEALKKGKHVYTEKPLAATFQQGREIMSLAKEKRLNVGCSPDTFLGGRIQTYKKLIDGGEIGKVMAGSAFVVSHGHEWHHPNPDFFYKEGAGPLLDIGPYYITALLALLGPVTRCCGFTNRALDEREIDVEPKKGEKIKVEVDTHVAGTLEFENGAIVTLIASFDVWDSQLPRIELYGTQGTICMDDIDPLAGPNLFGGKVLMKKVEDYRWTENPRKPESLERPWREIPVKRAYSETGHDKNSRGIGLVDMAYAIRDGRSVRASGDMALHALEVMEGLLRAGKEGRYINMTTWFRKPDYFPDNFPESEGEMLRFVFSK